MTSTPPPPDAPPLGSPPQHMTDGPPPGRSAMPEVTAATARMTLEPPRLSPRSVSTSDAPATTAAMTASSTPLGGLNAARRPVPQPTFSRGGSGLNVSSDIQARMKAFRMQRQGAPAGRPQPPNDVTSPPTGSIPPSPAPGTPLSGPGLATPGGIPSNFRMPPNMVRPPLGNVNSAPTIPNMRIGGGAKPSLAEKRGLALPGGLPGATPSAAQNGTAPAGRKKKPGFTLSQINGDPPATESGQEQAKPNGGSMMDKYSEYIDKETGSLKFKGKAVINSQGVEFASGSSFSISLDEVDTLDELGKGNYGTVYKVRHSRPRMRRPGQGLAGNKATGPLGATSSPISPTSNDGADKVEEISPIVSKGAGATTGIVMAMKEIRLELDDAKFAAIIMELDILHRCISPYIVDFYGAFFQEGAVYICMEFMDGGSIDKLYGDGIPEGVLKKITYATTMGLKSLKDEHNIIHRDVKPTNILMNTRGQIKICDFGVSGNLVASIAKTNIGCQSYMAPERISTGGMSQAGANPGGGTYSVQSDIWSLGLTIIECALGQYPYPPETYNNIFSQLSAIVDGEPPDLPKEGFSDAARNFVRGCLHKVPKLRPTYAMLLQHAWLAPLTKPLTITEEDEEEEVAAAEAVIDASGGAASVDDLGLTVIDKEVADWVKGAIERRKAGAMGKKAKPALHAAPLDAVKSPVVEKELNGM